MTPAFLNHSFHIKGFRLLLLCAASLASVLLSLRCGTLDLSFAEIREVLKNGEPPMEYMILTQVRLPRILAAWVTGAALAMSGATLQGLLRNPLASPGLIGISGGAGIAGVCLMLLFPNLVHLLIPASFTGAFAAALLVFLLAWDRGLRPENLILSGVAVSSLAGAGISAVMLFHAENAGSVLSFTLGGFSARSWTHLESAVPYLLCGTLVLLLGSGKLNILSLGDESAAALGLPVERTRLVLLAAAALLAACAVSIAGLLGFAGLIAPHMTRLLLGRDGRILLPGAALFGGTMVLLCDTLGRIVAAPAEIPAGVLLALLGAPFFLYLLRRKMRHDV